MKSIRAMCCKCMGQPASPTELYGLGCGNGCTEGKVVRDTSNIAKSQSCTEIELFTFLI